MHETTEDETFYNPTDVSPEMTRQSRGIRMWLPLKLYGTEPFQVCLEEKLYLARFFYEQVQKIGFAVGPNPELSVCLHRFVPKHCEQNEFNRCLMERVRKDGRIYISCIEYDGIFWLRIAILQVRTHLKDVQLYLDILKSEVCEEVKYIQQIEQQGVVKFM
jgi:aromatic-L-amino-acid/L-tryptophan decarboxylase